MMKKVSVPLQLGFSTASHGGKECIMLVLSRKSNESIVINNNIKVTVVEIRGDKVRLGIEAPKNIPVHREEIYNHINGQPFGVGMTLTPSK